jgi:hypothetical protein
MIGDTWETFSQSIVRTKIQVNGLVGALDDGSGGALKVLISEIFHLQTLAWKRRRSNRNKCCIYGMQEK